MRTPRILKRWWWVPPALILAALGAFIIWAVSGPAPMPQALAALDIPPASDGVAVKQGDWLTFRPTDQEPGIGLILYPGGRVDHRAYAPAGRAIAARGYLVVIVPMPLDFAFLAPARAEDVIAASPAISSWAVGGHSLGGAMAARFVHEYPSLVDGLVLWASYPAAADDLSDQEISVLSIYATRDGLATTEEVLASRPLLPPATTWVAIDGGNHAQFGWYGPQSGDLSAALPREAQQEQVVTATVDLLASLSR